MEELTNAQKDLPLRPKKNKSNQEGKQKKAPVSKEKTPSVPVAPMDPESMFKEGFLKSVYNERPSKHVVTRFPPEPKSV